MKVTATLSYFLLVCLVSLAQTEPITITQQALTLPGAVTVSGWKEKNPNQKYPYPSVSYAFAAGDEITVDFTISNKKGTQQIFIKEHPSNATVYSNTSFQNLEGHKIRIPKTAVYIFTFATNHFFDRSANLVIKRKPVSIQTSNFNCNVVWQTVNDTVFENVEQQVEVGRSYEAEHLIKPQTIVLGGNGAFVPGKSRVTRRIGLPVNTKEWYYIIGTSRDQTQAAKDKTKYQLFSTVASKAADASIPGSGNFVGIALDAIIKPPGTTKVDVSLIAKEDVFRFENKQDTDVGSGKWTAIREGTATQIVSAHVRVKDNCQTGVWYLALYNPSTLYETIAILEAVAIVENIKYEKRIVKKPVSVQSRLVAVY